MIPFLLAFLVNHYVQVGPEDQQLLVDPSSPQILVLRFFLEAPVVPLCPLLEYLCPLVVLVLLVTLVGPLALVVPAFPVVLDLQFGHLFLSQVVLVVLSNRALQMGLRDLVVLVYPLPPCLLSAQLDQEAQ